MKKIYFIIALSILLTSCNLDREPYGISNFWNTAEDVELGLNAAYEPYYEEEAFGRGHWWVGPASDDMVINRDNAQLINITEFRAAGANNTFGALFENWQLIFQSIRRANDVLKHAPQVEMEEKRRDIILAEANFICAFNYFFLAKRYGGLPFYDFKKPQEINKERETKEETYKRIEAYLKASIELFEKHNLWTRNDNGAGRPHLGAAYALLTKVYAHWAIGAKTQEKYKLCKATAEKVIGKYELNRTNNNGFAHLFSLEGEKHKEVLFNLVSAPTRHKGTVSSIILLPMGMSNGSGWSYFAPTRSLYDAFEDGDLRRRTTIIKVGDEINFLGKNKIVSTDDIFPMQTEMMCAKYSSAYNKLSSWQWESGADLPLLRYSDVLLLHAEAEIVLAGGGPQNKTLGVAAAAKSFNQVRVRAFGGDQSKAIAAPTFADLMRERRCELAYEDERHFDLVRWGLAKEVYAAATTSSDPRGARDFDPEKHAHFPIPQKELENTDGKLKNNPLKFYSSFD